MYSSSTPCSICSQSIVLQGYPVRINCVRISVKKSQRDVLIYFLSNSILEAQPKPREHGLGPSCHDRQGRVSLLIGVAQPAGCLQELVDSPLELDVSNQ